MSRIPVRNPSRRIYRLIQCLDGKVALVLELGILSPCEINRYNTVEDAKQANWAFPWIDEADTSGGRLAVYVVHN